MTFPNFPQNSTNYDQRQIINFQINWPMFALGVASGVLAVHFIIDSHKVALCRDDSIFKCYFDQGEIVVKLRRTAQTAKPITICENLQKDYFDCLQKTNKAALAESSRPKPAPKPNHRNDTPPDECLGNDCPPSDEPTPF